uniref:Poly(A) polymerase catalytic subunit domain-containing protein n=1 Tax=viral metagenome TaxID=1070528 RepID=A0A6C0CU11_9ZZZZ
MDRLLYKKFQGNLEKQLQRIAIIAEKKNQEIEKYNYNKYKYLYDICVNFLKKYDILLYGGSAINDLLPKKAKFYKEYELPDIDLFTYDAKGIIKALIIYFKKQHHIDLITASEALHKNTFKVYSQGLQLLDITQVSKKDFKILKKNAVSTSFNIPSVNIEFLKYTIHTISSQPYDAHRWPKVYERMLKFYEYYPLNYPCKFNLNNYYLSIPNTIYDNLLTFIQERKMPSFGWDVIYEYLKEDPIYLKLHQTVEPNVKPIQYAFYEGPLKIIEKEIHDQFKNLHVIERYKGDLFLPAYSVFAYEKEKCLYVFETKSCLSVLQLQNNSILSIHSILTMFYAMYLAGQSTDLLCIIQFLTAALFKNLLSRKKLFNKFSLECYGKQQGIITLRRERFKRNLKNKNIFTK